MIYLFVIRSSIRRTILVAVFAAVVILSQDVVAQYKYHSAPPKGVGMMRGQANEQLPSILLLDDGRRVKTAEDWWGKKRPELVKHWTEILGKLGPGPADEKWFGDITQIEIVNEVQCEGYRRLEVLLPMEKDFKQPHLLLIPDDVGDEPLPSVIAWTSTSPDYRQPEVWWGEWLAKRGVVVLTGWSFIRNYRQGTTYNTGAHELVYQRFGHWLSMGKMIHDVRREAEFLQSLPEVDNDRIGFIGFSLSAKTALYVAAFATEVKATVSIDPHLPIYGD